MKRALELGEALSNSPNPGTVDNIVDFLLPYVKEPEDREQAADLLWSASEEQFTELMELVGGQAQAENPTPD
jgi:hypothetical protein